MSESAKDYEERLIYETNVSVLRADTHRAIAKLYRKLAAKEAEARSTYLSKPHYKPRKNSVALIECERHNEFAEHYEIEAGRRLKKLKQLVEDGKSVL
jgi:hypothetical protein